ncbi:MAG TPA: penicillin-binding protein 2 [Gaiellaceae bacterium]|nr:penicillin-binding protein 2 [Gaiellaceae bacterium]
MASTTTRPPSRRFLPREQSVVEPYRLTPRLALRVAVLGGLVVLVFGALFLRLWALQVLSGTKYVSQAQAISSRTVAIQAPRGVILDRNGNVLVSNTATTAVELWPADLPKSYVDRYDELRALARVTRIPLYEIAAAIKARQGDPVTPVVIRESARTSMVDYLAEHSSQFPGVETPPTYMRQYPYRALAAQVLGYVGEISASELATLARKGYRPGDVIGQAGVESSYDTYLRGVAGAARVKVDAMGRPVDDFQVTQLSKPGHAVRLTLDVKLQQAAEKALQYGIHLAQANGQWAARGGAIVAMDPNDGSILALASSPSYEPSVYAGHVTVRDLNRAGLTAKTAAEKNYPSLNRALQATYPPGSVFKPVTALAAMQSHLVSPYATLPCTGTYTAPGDRSHRTFHNWDPNVNQAMDLPTALAYSCDTYFYRLGYDFYALPGDRGQPLQKWATAFGFGQVTGTDAGPEVSGLVPTIGWLHQRFTPKTDPHNWQVDQIWKPGNSIQLAIGQGDLLVTPLQMARFYALIANGGKLVTPHVLMDVENPNGTAVPVPAIPAPQQVAVDPAALRVVQQGLYEGTHMPFGTSYAVFGSFPVPIVGKTGTAEKVVSLPGYLGTQNQSWWCGYGPVTSAKLVVCAVIENGGHGGTAAAPAAAQVFSKFFHVKLTQNGPIHSD